MVHLARIIFHFPLLTAIIKWEIKKEKCVGECIEAI